MIKIENKIKGGIVLKMFRLEGFSLEQSPFRNTHPNIQDTPTCPFYLYYTYFFKNVISIDIPEKYEKILMDALMMGNYTRNVPEMFKEELDALVKELPSIPESSSGWFVRSDTASLKYGVYGTGPYKTWDEIITSTVTCRIDHHPITSPLRFYFLPIQKIHDEFRVFVCNYRVVGISVANIYCVSYHVLKRIEHNTLKKFLERMVDYVNETVIPVMKKIEIPHATLDIAELEDGTIYFMEMNRYSSSGSAGFFWEHDDCLYSGEEQCDIPFRYVNDNE